MKQEDKDLLLRDLSARLPYGVICNTSKGNGHLCSINQTIFDIEYGINIKATKRDYFNDREEIIKPYLFPLSSVTEEQRKEISKRYNLHLSYGLCIEITNHSEGYWDDDTSCHLQDYLWLVDWFNKNHFDYHGLIPMGLAKDATGLNIY